MAVRQQVCGVSVAVTREEGRWMCVPLADDALTTLDTAITDLRRVCSSGALFAMLAVDDEFFLIIRPTPRGVDLLLSDGLAALDYDIAADVLDLLRVDTPDEDDDEVWPVGDLAILADLGLPAEELQLIVDEVDLYPDEQLVMIAARCGFADVLRPRLDGPE
jgi:putative tRNA adenosine deaminase-associated protein